MEGVFTQLMAVSRKLELIRYWYLIIRYWYLMIGNLKLVS